MPAIWPAVGRAGEFDRSLSTRFSELLAIEPAVSGVVTSHVDYSGWKLQ
jgi:hypothetical protein